MKRIIILIITLLAAIAVLAQSDKYSDISEFNTFRIPGKYIIFAGDTFASFTDMDEHVVQYLKAVIDTTTIERYLDVNGNLNVDGILSISNSIEAESADVRFGSIADSAYIRFYTARSTDSAKIMTTLADYSKKSIIIDYPVTAGVSGELDLSSYTGGYTITFERSGSLESFTSITFPSDGSMKIVNPDNHKIFNALTTIVDAPVNTIVQAEWFGAVGDSLTDCTTAIQAALDYFNYVELNDDVYLISEPLVFRTRQSGTSWIAPRYSLKLGINTEIYIATDTTAVILNGDGHYLGGGAIKSNSTTNGNYLVVVKNDTNLVSSSKIGYQLPTVIENIVLQGAYNAPSLAGGASGILFLSPPDSDNSSRNFFDVVNNVTFKSLDTCYSQYGTPTNNSIRVSNCLFHSFMNAINIKDGGGNQFDNIMIQPQSSLTDALVTVFRIGNSPLNLFSNVFVWDYLEFDSLIVYDATVSDQYNIFSGVSKQFISALENGQVYNDDGTNAYYGYNLEAYQLTVNSTSNLIGNVIFGDDVGDDYVYMSNSTDGLMINNYAPTDAARIEQKGLGSDLVLRANTSGGTDVDIEIDGDDNDVKIDCPELQIGKGVAGIDYKITFDGENSNGVIKWLEDEGMFDFDNDVAITGVVSAENIGVYGELYEDSPNTASITTDYVTIGSLTGAGAFSAALDAGVSNGVTIGDSTMTIVATGIYTINVSASFSYATAGKTVHFSLFVDDVEETKLKAERKIGTGGDIGNANASAIVSLTAGEVLKIKFITDNVTSADLVVNHFNWNILRID